MRLNHKTSNDSTLDQTHQRVTASTTVARTLNIEEKKLENNSEFFFPEFSTLFADKSSCNLYQEKPLVVFVVLNKLILLFELNTERNKELERKIDTKVNTSKKGYQNRTKNERDCTIFVVGIERIVFIEINSRRTI